MEKSTNKREYLRRKEKERKRKRWFVAGLILLGVILIFGLAILLPRIILNPQKFEGSTGFSLGDPNAPITVDAFSSYTCSHCKDFSENEEKSFIKEYVDTGKVFYRYINLAAFNEQGILANTASYCAADQDRFFDYKGLLFSNALMEDGFSQENLINYANYIGMDIQAFTDCLNSDTYAKAYIDDRSYASALGITFTPAFSVNGQVVTTSELIPTVEMLMSEQ